MVGWKGLEPGRSQKESPREFPISKPRACPIGGWREHLILARHPGTVKQRQGPQHQHSVQHPCPEHMPLQPRWPPAIPTDRPGPSAPILCPPTAGFRLLAFYDRDPSTDHGSSLLPFIKKAIKGNVKLSASMRSPYRPNSE